MKRLCTGCKQGTGPELGRVTRCSRDGLSGDYHASCFEAALREMRPAPRPPIDMMAWKAMRNREVAEKNNLTPEEKTEYDEEVADSSKFFAERVDELFGIALRKFSVHPADIIDHAFQHMLRHALCMYHLEPDDRDETFSKPVLALLAFLRVDGTKLIVMCRHERPYLDCPECLAITKQDDEAARLEMQSWEDDDE